MSPVETKRQQAMALLTAAVAAAGKGGKAAVASRLGYGRALLSRVLSPNDPLEMSEALADRVIDRFCVIPDCPATHQPQPRNECRRLNQSGAPMHNPLSMRIWRVCQTCPHKPIKEGETK